MDLLEGLVKAAEGLSQAASGANPFVKKFEESVHGPMIDALLDQGFTDEQVTSLIDVERTTAVDYISLETRMRTKYAKKTEAKTPKP